MKARHLIAALTLGFAVVLAGPASAGTESVSMKTVQFSVDANGRPGDGDITVTINGNTATLTGFANGRSRQAAERAVLSHPRISKVVNLLLTNS